MLPLSAFDDPCCAALYGDPTMSTTSIETGDSIMSQLFQRMTDSSEPDEVRKLAGESLILGD